MSDQFDGMIQTAVAKHFSELMSIPGGWCWIKAQVWAESGFDPKAKSPRGAMGLLQMMPGTAREMGVADPYDPEQSLAGGVAYLAKLWRNPRIAATEAPLERLKWALASYNGGPGYVYVALGLAREKEGLPFGFAAWQKAGSMPGPWQVWEFSRAHLCSSRCSVRGKNPDYRQILDYVKKITERCDRYVWGQKET